MAKTYRVNITRTITMECSILIRANGPLGAREKAQDKADAGKLGEPYVTFREYGKTKDLGIHGDEINEEIEVGDATLDDE